MQQVKQLLQQLLDDPDRLQRWWGQYVTEPKHPEQPDPDQDSHSGIINDELQQLLSQTDSVRRAEGVRYAFAQNRSGIQLFVDGHCFPLPLEQLALVHLLCDQNSYTSQQLNNHLKQSEAQQLLLTLFNNEHLYCD